MDQIETYPTQLPTQAAPVVANNNLPNNNILLKLSDLETMSLNDWKFTELQKLQHQASKINRKQLQHVKMQSFLTERKLPTYLNTNSNFKLQIPETIPLEQKNQFLRELQELTDSYNFGRLHLCARMAELDHTLCQDKLNIDIIKPLLIESLKSTIPAISDHAFSLNSIVDNLSRDFNQSRANLANSKAKLAGKSIVKDTSSSTAASTAMDTSTEPTENDRIRALESQISQLTKLVKSSATTKKSSNNQSNVNFNRNEQPQRNQNDFRSGRETSRNSRQNLRSQSPSNRSTRSNQSNRSSKSNTNAIELANRQRRRNLNESGRGRDTTRVQDPRRAVQTVSPPRRPPSRSPSPQTSYRSSQIHHRKQSRPPSPSQSQSRQQDGRGRGRFNHRR
jgi:hypothetical protein